MISHTGERSLYSDDAFLLSDSAVSATGQQIHALLETGAQHER